MKRFALILPLISSIAYGAPFVSEFPAQSLSSTTCTSIATGTWTASSSSNMSGRAGLFVINKTTNIAYGTDTNTDAVSTTAFLFPAQSMTFMPLSEATTLYLLSVGSGAQTLCVKQVKQ